MLRRLFIIIKVIAQNLYAHKLRTFLTILGVIIGIAAVMIVTSIGSSAQSLILDQVRNVGSNLVIVLPGASEEDGPPAIAFGIVTTSFTNDDLDAIKKLPHIEAASGYVQGSIVVQYGNESYSSTFQGVSHDFINVENAELKLGRFLSENETYDMSRVVVLGSQKSEDLFGQINPLGKKVKIGKQSFRVIGVMKERGSVAFSNPDSTVYVPLITAQKQLLGIDYLTAARIKVDDEDVLEQTKENIRELLRDRHDIEGGEADDFSVRDAASALAIVENVTNILKYFLSSVAGIALIVGGIGVMNIMLISLKQRIREIGLRKALGALNREIVWQFLIESIFISLIGAFLGIVLGIIITYIAAVVIQSLGYTWPFILTFESVFFAVGISFLIGILFGLYPARRAAQVSPTEALRYE